MKRFAVGLVLVLLCSGFLLSQEEPSVPIETLIGPSRTFERNLEKLRQWLETQQSELDSYSKVLSELTQQSETQKASLIKLQSLQTTLSQLHETLTSLLDDSLNFADETRSSLESLEVSTESLLKQVKAFQGQFKRQRRQALFGSVGVGAVMLVLGLLLGGR